MAHFDFDELINPLTANMSKAELKALHESTTKRFYTGIYAPDTVPDRDYYKKHKAELASMEEE